MSKLFKRLISVAIMLLALVPVLSFPVSAGYMDECFQDVLPMENGTYIGAVQCAYLDFFIYFDQNGKVTRRNYVPPDKLNTYKLVSFIPEDRMYLLYYSDEGETPGQYGKVADFKWNTVFDAYIGDAFWVTTANGRWWCLVEGPAIREISFDGLDRIDHPLPEIRGVNYFKDLLGFTVDSQENFVMLFSPVDDEGFCKDGIVRKIKNGKVKSQWVVDIPNVPEMKLLIGWVSPLVDADDNIYIAHYEFPCGAITTDRVRIHKYNRNGAELWSWGEKLFLVSDMKIAQDGNLVIFRPGGPVYKMSKDGKYLGQVVIEGITQLGEPECPQG